MKYLLDKISKQTLFFISLIGIVVVSLVMVTTFAYQTIQVEYKSDSKKDLTVNAGVLDVTFNVTNRINDSNIPFLDDYVTANYSEFTIDNTKSSEDASYKIKLVDLEYSDSLKTSDFKYTITNVNNNNKVIIEGDFAELSGSEIDLLSHNIIDKNTTQNLRLYLWLKNSDSDQSSLKNASFKGKIEINSIFKSDLLNNDNTLRNTIIKSAIDANNNNDSNRTRMGREVLTVSNISGENERVLNNAPDDYGTSYYFRGNVLDNYVTFANKTWRIVRINGDGSIRLILEDVAKDSSGSVITTAFNSSYNDNAYVGYMYGTPGSATYDATHENINDSTIKAKVDKWYEDNLKKNYANYLSDTLFCNDKTLASSSIGYGNTVLGYGTNTTYYASVERLEYSTRATYVTTSKPTFKCAENANNTYSRFTVDVTTLPNGKQTNGNLKYPIGLLTADEVAYAGAYKHYQTNKTYYLYNSSITSIWWLSSPGYYDGSSSGEWYVNGYYGYIYNGGVNITYYVFRPSINLKASILINGGDGTSSNPYTLKLN